MSFEKLCVDERLGPATFAHIFQQGYVSYRATIYAQGIQGDDDRWDLSNRAQHLAYTISYVVHVRPSSIGPTARQSDLAPQTILRIDASD